MTSDSKRIKMWHVVLTLLISSPLSRAYSDWELERGEVCIKLCVLYHSLGDSRVFEVAQSRQDLDRNKVEDRVMMDMFNYCTKHVQEQDFTDIVKANTREHLDKFMHYLQFTRSKYEAPDVDLTVTEEEKKYRTAAMRPRSRSRIADMKGTQEALKYAERIRREREEAKNLL